MAGHGQAEGREGRGGEVCEVKQKRWWRRRRWWLRGKGVYFSYAVDTHPLRSGNAAHVCTKGGRPVIWKKTRSPNNETLLIPPWIIQHVLMPQMIDGW